MKKKYLIISLIIAVLFITSCGGVETNADEHGNIMVYAIDNLPESGVFVKSGAQYFPAMPAGNSLSGDEFPYDGATMNPERFLWFVNQDHLMPVYDLSKNHELILRSDSLDISQSLTLEKFEDRGYTIGAGFTEADNTGLYRFAEDRICPGSSAANILKSASDMDQLTVLGINDQKMSFGMFDASGTLINLRHNGVYELNIYQGTSYTAVDVAADCHIYFSAGNIYIERFNLTRNGYAVIVLPEDFPSGVYNIAGYGLINIITAKQK